MKVKALFPLFFLISLCVYPFLIVYAQNNSNLVLWLKFDGNLKDSSPKGYDAQSYCSPLTFKEGIKGKSLYLDGINDYILIPDKPEFSIVNNPNGMTISFWISPASHSFPTQNDDGYIRFLGKGNVGQHEWCFVMYNASNPVERPFRISFYIHNATGGYGIGCYVQEPYDINEWIFITGVIKNGVLSIYKNGIWRRDSYNYTEENPIGIINPEDTDSPLTIGKRIDVDEFFMGKIDDFRIYNKALTDSEIKSLFDSYFVPDPMDDLKRWLTLGFTALILLSLGLSILYKFMR